MATLTMVLPFLFCLVLYNIFSAIAVLMLGWRVAEFAIGFGPNLIGKEMCKTFFCIRLIPFGGSVRIGQKLTSGSIEKEEEQPSITGWKYIIFQLSAPVFMFLFASIIYFRFNIGSLFVGAYLSAIPFLPLSSEHLQMLRQFYIESASGSLLPKVGYIALWFSAMNLLPIPFLSGGNSILSLIDAIFTIKSVNMERIKTGGCFVCLFLYVYWIVMAVRFFNTF